MKKDKESAPIEVLKKAKKSVKEEIKKEEIKALRMNEQVFRVGDKHVVNDIPFEVKEVRGLELLLKRTDIKR